MQLRRFTASSTPAALGAVRLALGDEAIILANRRLGDQVEIIATGQMDDGAELAEVTFENFDDISPEPLHETKVERRDASRELSEHINSTVDNVASSRSVFPDDKVSLSGTQQTSQTNSAAVRQNSYPSEVTSNPGSREAQSSAPDLYSVELPPASSASAAEKKFNSERHNVATRTVSGSLNQQLNDALAEQAANFKAEIAVTLGEERKQMLAALDTQSSLINTQFKGLEVKLWGNSAPNRTAHLQGLFALGIGAELAIQLVEKADPQATVDEALRHSFALLKTTLPIATDKSFSVPGVTIMSGPPGSGKTTALVKLATQHVKACGRDSIVIICADTRRIGAFEELQAYGRLLGVPTVHAHDKPELASLVDAFTHKQLVLIDHTLPLDEESVELPVNLLVPKNPDTVRHLFTLAANTQAASVEALVARHCNGRKMHCVLTQLDTSARLGELFNVIIRHHLPIAYWSDSASVQTPLQKADASVLVATAVAMSQRVPQSPDDQWLNRLIQPSDQLLADPLVNSMHSEVSVA